MNWKFSSRNPYPWEMYQLEFEANGESLFLTFEGVGEFREATLYRSTGADSDYIATLQCEGRKASGDKEKIGLALAEIEHFINEDYLTHNGSTLLRSENLADVASDREAKMAELKKSVAEDFSGCSFDFRTSKTDVLSYLKSMDGESVAEIQSRLETLEKANQIAFVVQALWNGQKGDSEYCNVNRMILYTKAGFSLMISVEETD